MIYRSFITVNTQNRLTLPKDVVRLLKIESGDLLRIDITDDIKIIIEKVEHHEDI